MYVCVSYCMCMRVCPIVCVSVSYRMCVRVISYVCACVVSYVCACVVSYVCAYIILYVLYCMCVYVSYVDLRGPLARVSLSFNHMGPRDTARVLRLGQNVLGHLTGPTGGFKGNLT